MDRVVEVIAVLLNRSYCTPQRTTDQISKMQTCTEELCFEKGEIICLYGELQDWEAPAFPQDVLVSNYGKLPIFAMLRCFGLSFICQRLFRKDWALLDVETQSSVC